MTLRARVAAVAGRVAAAFLTGAGPALWDGQQGPCGCRWCQPTETFRQ